ncbi:MAG: FAD-dependent oxidoreductase [Firmicutes bacterium]|nr:FAD-dependent oxidoreductase [Bacillota bacterium]
MKKQSLWENTYEISKENSGILDKDIDVDILIIGGGITGLSTMMELRNVKKSMVMIEKGTIGMGVTKNTTGKLTFLQGNFSTIEKAHDFFSAYLYYRAQRDAIEIVKNRVSKFQIDCELEEEHSYLMALKESEIASIQKEEAFLRKAGIPYEVEPLPISQPCQYAIKVTNTYTFHPLKYLEALKNIILKKGHKIYEHTKALTLDKEDGGYIVKTEHAMIHAREVVVATHYPFFVVPGFIPFKSYIEKSYLLASKVSDYLPVQAINMKKPIVSIRYWNQESPYLIYGGESTKTSKIINPIEKREIIEEKYKTNLLLGNIEYVWETHDVMSVDSLPFIGKVNDDNPNLYLATGYSKWGMTNSTIAGRIIADMIQNKKNPYESLFLPNRKSIPLFLGSIMSGIENSSAYFLAKIKKRRTFYDEHVEIIYENGKRIGVYIDQFGNRFPVSNVCPHMKCNLVFNPETFTWDCPCHGSSFDINGNVMTGPSSYSIKLEKEKKD